MKMKKVLGVLGLVCLLVGCGNSASTIDKVQDKVDHHQVFYTEYETTSGEFSGGTTFAVETNYCKAPILLTAHHIFGPAAGLPSQLNGPQVAEFVKGGKLYDMFSGEENQATIDRVIPVQDANTDGYDRDLAAFVLRDTKDVVPFTLAEKEPEDKEKVYLIAWVNDEDTGKIQLYEAEVFNQTETEVFYRFKEKLELTGSSGGPIINQKGEVVAMHLGGGEMLGKSIGVGHKSTSLNALLEQSYEALE